MTLTRKMRKSAHRFLGAFLLLSTVAGVSSAQIASNSSPATTASTAPPTVKPPAGSLATAPQKAEAKPFWAELTPAQQLALAPLQSEWSKIDSFRKKKWLQISSRFNNMKPDEQQRLQENMRAWAKLSPEERRHAREVYSRTKTLDAEQKSAQWQQYQQLPDTEKKQLATDIPAKKNVANLPKTGSVPAIKPPNVLGVPVAKSPPAVVVPGAAPASPAALAIQPATPAPVPAAEATPSSPAQAPTAVAPGK